MAKQEEYLLRIEKIITGGLGLARLPDGLVAMVPWVLPGELARVRIARRHKGYVEAELLAVAEEAAGRVAPECPHYGRCGGCQLQHVAAALQAELKDGILRDLVGRKVAAAGAALWQPPAAAPEPYGYRQRIRLQVAAGGGLGFHRPHSHEVEEVAHCPLARPELNAVLAQLAGNRKLGALLRQSEAVELILSPDDSRVYLFLHFSRKPRATDRQQAAAAAAELCGVAGLALLVAGQVVLGPLGEKSGSEMLVHYTLPAAVCGRALPLSLEPGGFCQVNQGQNEKLVRIMLAWAEIQPEERVLDLYSGMGNFSLPLALTAREVVGMDLQRSSIRSAQRNMAAAGLANCRFAQGTAVAGARELAERGEKFDCILLDPPRLGCREVVPFLPRLGARRLLYISCDPATLARDLEALAAAGYELVRLRMVDMFPQTHHLETIALLHRQG